MKKYQADPDPITPPSLHPAEAALLEYIRDMKFGSLTIKVQHGLPEMGEEVRASVKFNRREGK